MNTKDSESMNVDSKETPRPVWYYRMLPFFGASLGMVLGVIHPYLLAIDSVEKGMHPKAAGVYSFLVPIFVVGYGIAGGWLGKLLRWIATR